MNGSMTTFQIRVQLTALANQLLTEGDGARDACAAGYILAAEAILSGLPVSEAQDLLHPDHCSDLHP